MVSSRSFAYYKHDYRCARGSAGGAHARSAPPERDAFLAHAEVLARVQVLEEGDEIAAGSSGMAQLRLESPVVALPAERFIIRSYSPQHTFAGGRVLDAQAVKHRGRANRDAARAFLLELLAGADLASQLSSFVEAAGERGLRRAELAARTGWRDDVLDGALAEARKRGRVFDAEGVSIGQASFMRLLRAAGEEVEAYHRRDPLARGLARETLRERVFVHAATEGFER